MGSDTTTSFQRAPYPVDLADLLSNLRYKPRWRFELEHLDRGQGSEGLTLVVTITTPDSYHPKTMRTVVHYFPVPPAAYDTRSWQPVAVRSAVASGEARGDGVLHHRRRQALRPQSRNLVTTHT
jgi:hypothetical protein